MKDHYAPLIPGYFYHVYNRGNNRENLFYKPDNYVYFLQKYDLSSICLPKNVKLAWFVFFQQLTKQIIVFLQIKKLRK